MRLFEIIFFKGSLINFILIGDMMHKNTKNKQSLLSRFAVVIFILMMFFSVIISYFFISISQNNYDALIENIQSTRVKNINQEAKQRINQVIELIPFQKHQISISIKDKMRLKSKQILYAIKNIPNSKNKKINLNKTNEFLKNLANNKNKTLLYNDNFFLSNINNNKVNKSIVKNSKLKNSITDNIKVQIKTLLATKNFGIIDIFNNSKQKHFINAFLYVEKINDLGWYLGNLVSTEQFETQLKNNIIKQLKFMSLSKPVFVLNDELEFVIPPKTSEINYKKPSLIKDMYGNPLLESIKSMKNGGFIKYPSTSNVTGKETIRTAYIDTYHPWGWSFGTSSYTDEVSGYVSNIKQKMESSLEKTALNVLVITMSLLSGILLAATFFKHKLDLDMQRFIDVFNSAFKTNKLISEVPLKYREFVLLAYYANQILSERIKTHEELIHHATIDSLTQVYNRRQFMLLFGIEYRKSLKSNNNLVVIMVDIDHFKTINDKYGHQCGDFILQEFTKICKNVIRKTDLIGRIGGDEFVLLLLTLELDDALTIVEKIRVKVEQHNFIYEQYKLSLTISMGVSDIKEYHGDNESDMLKIADNYLYNAKNVGRNKMFSRNNKVETDT